MSEEDQSLERLLASSTTRRQMLLRASALGGLAAMGPLLAACGGTSATTTANKPVRGGALLWAWQFQPGNVLMPGMLPGYTPGELFPMLQIYDRLFEVVAGENAVQPGLATDWSLSSDGLRYTIKLRDAEFSNGMKVTADDVVFTLKRYTDGSRNLYSFMVADVIDRVRALDPATVEVTTKAPVGAFIELLAIPPASILPEKLVKSLGEKGFEKQPIGSGPFVFKSRQKGRSLLLERNPGYWQPGRPYLNSVQWDYVADPNARILRITSGDANVASSIPFSQLDRVKKSAGVRLQIEPTNVCREVWTSSHCKPLLDRHVRLALNLATPREAIAKSVYDGKVEIANAPFGKLKYWDKNVKPLPYDIERAKQEMAQSSVPDGFNLELLYVPQDGEARAIATILQDSWGQIGVKVKQQQTDGGTLQTKALRGDFDAMLGFDMSSDIPSEDATGKTIYCATPSPDGLYFPSYVSKKACDLATRARASVDEAERRKLFSELQHYGMQVDPPLIPIVFLNERTALKDAVQGLHTNNQDAWHLQDVWLSKA